MNPVGGFGPKRFDDFDSALPDLIWVRLSHIRNDGVADVLFGVKCFIQSCLIELK